MSVKTILAQAGAKMGLNPSAASSRAVLLRFLNEAADELYEQCDIPGSLVEQAFRVNGDQTISCPHYVGKIRAMREIESGVAWSLTKMRPRYNQTNWLTEWNNFRLKGAQPLMTAVDNESVGVLTVNTVENPPVVISVSGPTLHASESTEDVIMDAVEKLTVGQYTDYTSVKKDRNNNYDITLSDVDGKLLTVIPNNQLTACYQIVDVSAYPWSNVSSNATEHYLEILYKKILPILSHDNDEFPAIGYDSILVTKMLQLWFEEQGKGEAAMGYDAKATRSLARKIQDQNAGTEDAVGLVRHPHDTLLPRIT